MTLLRWFVLILAVYPTCLFGQEKKANFPTDEEINLVLTQADRAVQQYKPYIDIEEKMFGKKGEEAVSKDRQIVHGIETAIKAFAKDPQAFNGPLGFVFFEWLDDASRNALACANSASSNSVLDLMAGKTAEANAHIQLSQGCTAASNLLYTVSENAGALYTRYAEGEEILAKTASDIAQKCAEILKRNGPHP